MMRIVGMTLMAAMTAFWADAQGTPGVPSPQAPAPTFRGSAGFVSVDVSVRLRGRPVAGLTAQDFELSDNGVAQEIADLSFEKLPIDVTIALDVSSSVTGEVLDQLRRSVGQLRADLGREDRLRLTTFNTRVTKLTDFSMPASAIDAAFAQVRPSGTTAIFDAIAVALTAPADADRRQLVVVFSDGEDSGSITDAKVLLDVARETTPTLDVVLASTRVRAVLATGPSAAAVARTKMYTELARETGGVVESLSAGDDLSSAFRRALTDFRSSYVLHFIPRGVDRTGVHTLDVRLKRPGADVRARKSYTWK